SIPVIAGLLAMGVPLSAVMAFWLASPLMDPTMFAMTAGILGWKFAVIKALIAAGIGAAGGYATMGLGRTGLLTNPLRARGGGCCGSTAPAAHDHAPDPGGDSCCGSEPKRAVAWTFWTDTARRRTFAESARDNLLFLGQWLALAFALEAMMLAYLPQETVASVLGSDSWYAIPLAAVVGIPAYLNGYAALPLVSGLMEQGMSAGAGMAFLVAGGITCIPAGIAVWALARPSVFALYLGSAFGGAILFSLAVAPLL
ncbi:MAG: permease, partial [Alphaproteobacteria bacterium]|nr:permease [Alphaproteobacteria bacterium]